MSFLISDVVGCCYAETRIVKHVRYALGSRVSGLVTENGQLRAELDAAKLKNAEMVSDLKMNAAQQLASERERWNREKEDGSRGWENQRRDLTDNYDRMVCASFSSLDRAASINASQT